MDEPYYDEHEEIEKLKLKIDSLEATLGQSTQNCVDWMNEALAGRDTIQQLKGNNSILGAELEGEKQRADLYWAQIPDLRERNEAQKGIIEALQGREQALLLRINNAIFLLEDWPDEMLMPPELQKLRKHEMTRSADKEEA